jgi:alpha-glucosidase (family GH31 glycosyl hydrolase)
MKTLRYMNGILRMICFVLLFVISHGYGSLARPLAAPATSEPILVESHWWALGSFEWTDTGRLFWGDRPLPPEGIFDTSRTYEGRNGPIEWREVPEWDENGKVYEIGPRADMEDADVCLAAYLYRRIDAATDSNAILYLGFDDGLVLNFNGEKIFERFFYRDTRPRQEAIPVHFRKGRNDLLLKIVNKDNTNPSSFCFDVEVQPIPRRADSFLEEGIGTVKSFSRAKGRAVFETEDGSLFLSFRGGGTLRVTFVPSGTTWPYEPSRRPLPVEFGSSTAGPVPPVTEDSNRFIASTGKMTVELMKDGSLLLLKSPGQERRLEIGMSDNEEGARTELAVLHLDPREAVFGTGERYDAFNRRGRSNVIGNSDRAYGDSHFTLPYIMTENRDALFVNTYGGGAIDIDVPGSENLAVCRLEEGVVDLFYFTGGPKKLVRQYVDLTDHTVMPPDWTLGVWMSRNSYESEEVVLDTARRLRELEIPSDVLVLEGWRGEGREWMEWDSRRWPHHEEMCRTLHEMGFKIVFWTMQYHPTNLRNPTPGQKEALDKGYFVTHEGKPWGWEEGVYVVDFFNPAACDWWKRQYAPLFDPVTGIDALKTDIGENNLGRTVQGWDNINQIYALGYIRCSWEMTRELTGEGVVFARTGTVGTQRYPILWAGDHSTWFQGMQEACNAMLSTGIAGYAWTSFDIGGLYGDLDKETYIRMAQMGAFCPIMQAHGQGPREPYHFDEETVEIFKRYAGWYMDLKPYRIAAGKEACETGVPIVRPLWMGFPDDPVCYEAEYEYFFGPDILVAPIVSYNHERNVYLPDADWIDWWTGAAVKGGRWVEVEAPLERMPLYVRPGSPVLGIAPGGKETQERGKTP